jgi:hypothetical protein
MRLIRNSGNDRVVDVLKAALAPGSQMDIATPILSLFAYANMQDQLRALESVRLALPLADGSDVGLLGSDADRPQRNHLETRYLARQCADWINRAASVRSAPGMLPQSALITNGTEESRRRAITGNCPLTTDGLGLTPGAPFSLIQCSETSAEWQVLSSWFTSLWDSLPSSGDTKARLLSLLQNIVEHKPPALIYHLVLYHLFNDLGGELDEERIVKSATGIRNTVVWKKLFKFQRDGVIGAIDKLERIGGCILADSVGLGKTFEALAIIKYYELRNDRVLVLAPKRLRDNWTLYKANDRRNVLAADRLHYDVLNHTDLGREGGMSGDIDLTHVNWGNYDLVVIDESHNFRNAAAGF